ncbi:hypothetical protein Cal6303_1183 [Calothrix sp. PCC 6303]|nr:hypothetical protein Cal6303_1183 [Calothrix sp. PCC 6303]
MKSATLPSFWSKYRGLSSAVGSTPAISDVTFNV